MTKKTHLATGVAISLPLILKFKIPFIAIGILGSIVPDWDFLLGIEHRTKTHCLLAAAVTTIPFLIFDYRIGLVWGISYLSHLVLDSFTVMGVPFFYPFIKKRYGPKLIRTGGSEDLFLCLVALYFILVIEM